MIVAHFKPIVPILNERTANIVQLTARFLCADERAEIFIGATAEFCANSTLLQKELYVSRFFITSRIISRFLFAEVVTPSSFSSSMP
jgi:hypothetical protein